MRNVFFIGVLAVGASVFHPKTAHAYEPEPGKARNAFGGALRTCKTAMKKSVGELSEADYHSYVDGRDAGLKEDPKLPTWDVKYLEVEKPSQLYPLCQKFFSDYAAGVDAEKQPRLSNTCEKNTSSRLDTIINKNYPEFKAKGSAFVGAWFARKDLEAARYYMFQTQGYATGGAPCNINDHFKKAFAPIQEKFNKAEALVKEIEAGKGIRFEKIENGNAVIFIDVKTNQRVAKADVY